MCIHQFYRNMSSINPRAIQMDLRGGLSQHERQLHFGITTSTMHSFSCARRPSRTTVRSPM